MAEEHAHTHSRQAKTPTSDDPVLAVAQLVVNLLQPVVHLARVALNTVWRHTTHTTHTGRETHSERCSQGQICKQGRYASTVIDLHGMPWLQYL
jgi:hypothetical protein